MPDRREGEKPPLLTVRTTLVLLIAFLVAAGAGGLLLAAGRHPAEAAFGAVGAGAIALHLFHELIQ
jgi:hypothetical protein